MSAIQQKQAAARATGATSEDDLLEMVNKGHNLMMTVLSGRSRNLQIVRAMWTSGNTKVRKESLYQGLKIGGKNPFSYGLHLDI